MKWDVISNKAILLKSISIVIILSWFVWAVFYSLTIAINIPTTHLDGAFQTASGLFRLDDGQFPGRDFFPYLGIGPLYLLFPVYKLFGSNLAASIIASNLTVTISAMLSTAFIFHLIWKPKSILTSIAVSCLLIYVVAALRINVFTWGLQPGNSLRPLRAFVPYLSAIVFYLLIFRISSIRLKYIAAGMLTAAVLLWSNDYAFTTALLFGIFIFTYALLRKELTIKNWVWYVGSTLLLWGGLVYLACHGHPIDMLKYNFSDAAQDQFWYFGPYGENSRVFNMLQLLKLQFMIRPLGLIAFSFLVFHTIKYKSIESALLLWVGLALFAGGIVASVGGHVDSGYFSAYQYWLRMTCLLGILRLTWFYLSRRYSQSTINNQQSTIAAIIVIVVALAPMAIAMYQYRHHLLIAKNDANRFYVVELGGYLSTDWREYIQLARSTPVEISVVEEYWGIWSSLRRTFFNWPVDSIIHALGNTRNVAKLSMQRADMVISTRRTSDQGATEWQPWNLSQNYWFYESLLKGYAISSWSPNTIIWRKENISALAKKVQCETTRSASNAALNVNIASPGYYEISMQYKVNGKGRILIMVQNNINWAAGSSGYISINPKSEQAKFPAYFDAPEHSQLNVNVVGNNDAKIELFSCSAKKIAFSNEEVLPHPPITIGGKL